jgi:hypothetical protein
MIGMSGLWDEQLQPQRDYRDAHSMCIGNGTDKIAEMDDAMVGGKRGAGRKQIPVMSEVGAFAV